jgi:recombination protein RecA
VGAQARLMSQALRKIAGNASKCNCTVMFLNQLRHKAGGLPSSSTHWSWWSWFW